MLGDNHSLVQELPEYRDRIHELKMHNAHFARLYDEYHEVDKAIQRFEMEIETPSDEVMEEYKKQRLSLKDQLFMMLQA
ncbi:MAG: YdcH family protein [Thiothrix sp.]|nr:YdcH family protein [Thiothrix sp.]HPQ96731.1 YdcH family protein [Thiolinea sp.]